MPSEERLPAGNGLRGAVADRLDALGDWAAFSLRTLRGALGRHVRVRALLPVFANIGANSVGVVAVTGTFIGMVLAVQAYAQFRPLGLETSLGTVSNNSILSELGPVLAAVMLAGRVGSAMAAELGTMRVTEQIDALACLGVDPVHYLSSPRFLACVLLIPLLTVLADVAGIAGSSLMCLRIYGVDAHLYWEHTLRHVGMWELLTGLIKSVVFGAVLALICCYRGFRSGAGAEGVGRAATAAFVASFIAILILDFFLVFFFNTLRVYVWPTTKPTGF